MRWYLCKTGVAFKIAIHSTLVA